MRVITMPNAYLADPLSIQLKMNILSPHLVLVALMSPSTATEAINSPQNLAIGGKESFRLNSYLAPTNQVRKNF